MTKKKLKPELKKSQNNWIKFFIHILDILKVVTGIVLTILVLKWLGFKGMLGIIIGFALMGYLIYSGNPLFMSLIGTRKAEKIKMIKREFLE